MTNRTRQIEQLLENFQAIRRKLGSTATLASPALRRITPAQWGVLRIIAHKDHVSIKDIAGQLAISSSAATQLVDDLTDNGHLKRSDNPDDRRSQYIALSGTAKKQMTLLRKGHLKRLSNVFSALNDQELEQYLRLSAKVAHSVTSHSA